LIPLLLCAACLTLDHSKCLYTADLHAPDLTPLTTVRTLSSSPIRLSAADLSRLSIYTEDSPRTFTAALHLASTLETMLGTRPPIVRAFSSVTNAPGFYLGTASPLAASHTPTHHPEAFRVLASTTDTSYHFLGRADYAVYDFCERLLGERIYSDDPAAHATFIPRLTSDLILPRIDYTDQPAFNYRMLGSDYMPHAFARLAKVGTSHRGSIRVHQPSRWYQDTNLVARLPQIFALTPDGSRAASPLLCYSSSATLAYYRQRIDEHIAGIRPSGGIVDTTHKTITISPWDTIVTCACPTCRAAIDESLGLTASASSLLWSHFATRLATWTRLAHPDYIVLILPYINTCAIPPNLDFTSLSNIEATVCTMPGLALLKNPATRAREESLIHAWARTTGRPVINWHYTCWPAEFTDAPYLFGHLIQSHYQSIRTSSAGTFICSSSDRPRFSLDTYLYLRILWNPDTNVDAIYDAFCRHMFGPAAAPMRRLLALQEQGWARPWPNDDCSDENVFGISYPTETIQQMHALFNEAWQKTAADEQAQNRVLWYAQGFTRFFLQAENFAAHIKPAPLNFIHASEQNLPRIDGQLSDPIWKTAAPRTFVSWNDDITNSPPYAATVQTAYSTNGLYFAFTCPDSAAGLAALNPHAPIVEDTSRNTLKLVFDPTGTTTGKLYRIVLDYGARIQAFCDGIPFNPTGIQFKTARTPTAWTAELFIPASYLIPGTIPKGNIIRGRILTQKEGDARRKIEWTRLSTRGLGRDLDRNAFTDFICQP
jgi:hypothetical protein